jgi:diphosphomevalonate decarboxylase
MAAQNTWQTTWKSPSNIALVKYWGKHDRQLPNNPSISFTLDKAHTLTTIEASEKEANGEISLDFFFEGKEEPQFGDRIKKFLKSIVGELPVLKKYHLNIDSSNSFPHSTGIASSASAMSALALGLVEMESELGKKDMNDASFRQRASYFARLASGSACRSIYPSLAIWGNTKAVSESSEMYAVPASLEVHPMFESYHDDILIVSSAKKSVSSTAGHQLMDNNRFAEQRYRQAEQNLEALYLAMKLGDVERFNEIVEEEALTLHALMMTSSPSFILMRPNTLEIIERIRAFRNEHNIPVCFTLDAGPNIHLLYPAEFKQEVKPWIQSELKAFCEEGNILEDQVGSGPQKVMI